MFHGLSSSLPQRKWIIKQLLAKGSFFVWFEAFMGQCKMWGFLTSRRECLGLLPLCIQRQWSLYWLKGILISSAIRVCLLSLTRRREKSQTSIGLLIFFNFVCCPLSALIYCVLNWPISGSNCSINNNRWREESIQLVLALPDSNLERHLTSILVSKLARMCISQFKFNANTS